MRVLARDGQTTPITKRVKDKDGYLHVPGRIAASDNVQSYLAGELGLKGVDPKKVIRVYRPKAAMDAAAKSFDGKPITLEHPSKMVDAKLWRTVARGEAYDTRPTAEGLEAELVVKDATAIDAIEKGTHKELSAAYDFELTFQAGVSPHGQAYDAVASDVVGNHIAIVRRGRSRTPAGQPCSVADSDKGDRKMRVLVFDALLLGTATATTLPEMEDNAAAAVDTIVRGLASARDAAVQERDAVLTEAGKKLEAQAQDHAKRLKELEDGLPARIRAEAADQAAVLAGAERLGLKVEAKDQDAVGLRRLVLAEAAKDPARKGVMDAMVPDVAKASPEALKVATAALFAMDVAPKGKGQRAGAHDALSSALVGKKDKAAAKDGDDKAGCTGRESAMMASAAAWKRGKK